MRASFLYFITALLACLALASGCTKTISKTFTAREECSVLKHLDDPGNMRDEYDNCVLFTSEDLSDAGECKKKCSAYCEKLNNSYSSSFPDFVGCHCSCSISFFS